MLNFWGPFYENFFEKSLTMPKKTERGDPLEIFNIHSVAKLKKIERGPFGENFFLKIVAIRKN